MVQYAINARTAAGAYNIHRDYWKLIDDSHMHHDALTIQRLARAERGLMNYHTCKREELESFCMSRGLVFDRQDSVSSLLNTLECADEQATFDRFGDLPAELRLHIYGLHFETFGEALEAPVQPPITRVSKLMRREALPLFYESFTFIISIELIPDEHYKSHPKECFTNFWTTDVAKKPKAFWTRLPEQYLTMITKLHIEDTQQDRYTNPKYLIDLSANDIAASVELLDAETWDHPAYEGQKTELQKLVAHIAARPEGKKLQRHDIKEIIRRFDEEGWQGYEDEDGWHSFEDEEEDEQAT